MSKMLELRPLLEEFLKKIKNKEIEIYNEFSVQFELAIFIRSCLNNYKIELERNIDHFKLDKTQYLKKEMDLIIYNDKEKHCIEIKYPTNGQYPEQMFSMCKDISFLEELTTKAFFNESFALTIVDDDLFYKSNAKELGIYRFFRGGKQINGTIQKPTGKDKKHLKIKGKYNINWQDISDITKYYIVSVRGK